MVSKRTSQARDVATGLSHIVIALLAAPLLHRWHDRWGSTHREVNGEMPGDEYVPLPAFVSTRAITIDASPADVWEWLVQIGQGRGGFYSYDALENLVGCRMHSAKSIVPDLQELHILDTIRLAPGSAPSFRVVRIEPGKNLVLVSAGPNDQLLGPPTRDAEEPRVTWQWVLQPLLRGKATRLIARQRFSFPRSQSLLWQLVDTVDFVMERRMLNSLKARVEGQAARARHITVVE